MKGKKSADKQGSKKSMMSKEGKMDKGMPMMDMYKGKKGAKKGK